MLWLGNEIVDEEFKSDVDEMAGESSEMNSYRINGSFDNVGGEDVSKIEMDRSKFLNEESHLNLGGCMDTERMIMVTPTGTRPEDMVVEAEEDNAAPKEDLVVEEEKEPKTEERATDAMVDVEEEVKEEAKSEERATDAAAEDMAVSSPVEKGKMKRGRKNRKNKKK